MAEEQGYLIGAKLLRDIREVIRVVKGIRGLGVTNSPQGITINVPRQRAARQIIRRAEAGSTMRLARVIEVEDSASYGRYKGRLMTGVDTTVDPTTALVTADIVDPFSTTGVLVDCTIWNLPEINRTETAALSGWVLGLDAGQTDEDTPRTILLTWGFGAWLNDTV